MSTLRFMCALSVNFAFRLNGQNPCLGTEFSPAGENSGGFLKSPIKGCLQTFEELSQKDTKVLPQAKCRETSHYSRNPPANSLKGSGNFLLRKFPASLVKALFSGG